MLQQVVDLYDGYGRGMDGMQLPYDVKCFRSRVVKSAVPKPAPAATQEQPGDTPPSGGDTPPPGDDGTLLIDFR